MPIAASQQSCTCNWTPDVHEIASGRTSVCCLRICAYSASALASCTAASSAAQRLIHGVRQHLPEQPNRLSGLALLHQHLRLHDMHLGQPRFDRGLNERLAHVAADVVFNRSQRCCIALVHGIGHPSDMHLDQLPAHFSRARTGPGHQQKFAQGRRCRGKLLPVAVLARRAQDFIRLWLQPRQSDAPKSQWRSAM